MTCMGWGIRVGILTLDWMRGSDVFLLDADIVCGEDWQEVADRT